MLTTLTIGILSSIVAEIITKINKALTNTVLHGKGAFLLAMVIALVGAGFKVVYSGVSITDWHTLGTTFVQVWTIAQGFFVLVVETLGLDVKDQTQG